MSVFLGGGCSLFFLVGGRVGEQGSKIRFLFFHVFSCFFTASGIPSQLLAVQAIHELHDDFDGLANEKM